MKNTLEIPCSYQGGGGKQRLAKQIIDIIYEENEIGENTKFYDLCCGSGAISLELINRGIDPNNITMIDNDCFGQFWQEIANDEFDLKAFREELDKIPSVENIQKYLKNLCSNPVDQEKITYHYLLLQAGAFGAKQVWVNNDKWRNGSFRNYWLPTGTSNRKRPVNPMMPMPDTLYKRIENIVNQIGGCIVASKEDVFDSIVRLNLEKENGNNDVIVYIDPPYMNTTGYHNCFDVYELVKQIPIEFSTYVSEGIQLNGAKRAYLLSDGRSKGNINGDIKKKPVQEWLNSF